MSPLPHNYGSRASRPIEAIDSFTLNRVDGKWVGHSRPYGSNVTPFGENMQTEELWITAAHGRRR